MGIWKIEESEEFFRGNVPLHRDVTHPMKRLQHLAGRFLLQYLFPDFPYEMIRIADTRKPFLPNEDYHFSISHCGDYAAAIVSRTHRVGIDVEKPVEKILKIRHKFISVDEISNMRDSIAVTQENDTGILGTTLSWSAKEAVFKWYGEGGVDFREDMHILRSAPAGQKINLLFTKTGTGLEIHYRVFPELVLTWLAT